MMGDNGLNERQYRFVVEYLKDFNATAAYQRAGYNSKGKAAEANAARLIRDDRTRAALVRAREDLMAQLVVDKDWVVENLRRNHDRATQAEPVYDKKGNPTGEYTYQAQAANKALELLGKELGMFKDKVEISGGPEPIKHITVVRTIRGDEH